MGGILLEYGIELVFDLNRFHVCKHLYYFEMHTEYNIFKLNKGKHDDLSLKYLQYKISIGEK